MPRGKALILPLWSGSHWRHELAPGQEEGMPKAAAQSNAPPVRPGSARVSGRGRGSPTEKGREGASHLLLLLRPRFGSSLPSLPFAFFSRKKLLPLKLDPAIVWYKWQCNKNISEGELIIKTRVRKESYNRREGRVNFKKLHHDS